MRASEFIKSAIVIVVIFAVFGLAAFGLNFYTKPLIDANNKGAANERLNAVMPDGVDYIEITMTLKIPEKYVDSSNSSRTAQIIAVYEETSGLGYIVEVAWTSEDTHGSEPNVVLVGISTDGKIIKVNNEIYHDTDGYNIFVKDTNYASTFEGQDSTLVDVGLVAGSTHSSTSFRLAVNHAFDVLILNDMITAGVKDDNQILTEFITKVAPSFASLDELNATGNITKAYKCSYDIGFALIMNDGSANYLAIVNAFGTCKIYDTSEVDVTSDHSDLVTEAQNFASANQKNYYSAGIEAFANMIPGASNFEQITNVSTFGTIVTAAKFTNENGDVYYGFYSRAYGFNQMDIYYILNTEGKIVKFNAKTLIFEQTYFMGFAGIPDGYTDGFIGLTDETFEDQAIIATATMTSNAVKTATKDAFAAFESIKGGAQ